MLMDTRITFFVRLDVGLELEGALVPLEDVVDSLFDLHGDVFVKILLRERSTLHQQLAQLLPPFVGLLLHGRRELIPVDYLVLHQELAEAVRAVHHGRIDDPTVLEVDVAEVGLLRQ